MKKYLIAITTGVLLLLTNSGFAQDKITEDLNNASIIFEEGQVKESLRLLKEIEKRENLSKAQKENLYRQMTICYIILNSDNIYVETTKEEKDSTSNVTMAKES